MGRHTVNFKCHSTGHCCKDVICLPTPWDVIRITRETGAKPSDFLEFVTPEILWDVEAGDPTWLDVRGDRFMMALRRIEKGCFFLQEKTHYCEIYESRPLLCRLYPFKLHESREGELKGFSLHADVGCPKHRDGVYQTQPLYDMYLVDKGHHEDYDKLVEVFNARDYPGKKPEDFVDMFLPIAPLCNSAAV